MGDVTYLTNLPSEICNETGLSKTLLTRRETIRLKHLQKTLFVYHLYDDEELLRRLRFMQFKGLMQYFEFLTNQLRGIYKFTRRFSYENVDSIVKRRSDSFVDLIRMYRSADPIVVVDFDRTLTNKKFHSLYNWLAYEGVNLYINTANPSIETVEAYLTKHDLPSPKKLFCNRGKQQKVVHMKVIAMKHIDRPLFCVDDELEYLEYANMLFYQCYQYTSGGKIRSKSINIK